MNQEAEGGERVELLSQVDMEKSAPEEDQITYKVLFPQLVEIQQFRIARGGTLPHQNLKESITQRGEEIERLEIFTRDESENRGFKLIASSEKISEKGNHDTIIPIDPNYTVYSTITSDLNGPSHIPWKV